MGFKASETLLGIETENRMEDAKYFIGFKASETLLGIETAFALAKRKRKEGFKASETLLGIETDRSARVFPEVIDSKPLKPF